MIEPVMFFGIGFLVAALLGLLFVPLVHHRAVRLTMRRLEAATPLSIAEIRADKDQLRAEFAMSTRRLEMSVEQMKAKTSTQLAELGKKSDAIGRLKLELGEKSAALLILLGMDFRHRHRGHGFEPPLGQANRPGMHHRDETDDQQAGHQETDPDIHDRFDHEWRSCPMPALLCARETRAHIAMTPDGRRASGRVNLNRRDGVKTKLAVLRRDSKSRSA
jgi:hypothetical protein